MTKTAASANLSVRLCGSLNANTAHTRPIITNALPNSLWRVMVTSGDGLAAGAPNESRLSGGQTSLPGAQLLPYLTLDCPVPQP